MSHIASPILFALKCFEESAMIQGYPSIPTPGFMERDSKCVEGCLHCVGWWSLKLWALRLGIVRYYDRSTAIGSKIQSDQQWQPRFRLPTVLHLEGAWCRFERTTNLPISCNKFVSLIHFLYSTKLRTIWLHETLYCERCFKMKLHGSGSVALLGLCAPRCHMLLVPRRLHEALTDNRLALSGGQGSNNKAPRRL